MKKISNNIYLNYKNTLLSSGMVITIISDKKLIII